MISSKHGECTDARKYSIKVKIKNLKALRKGKLIIKSEKEEDLNILGKKLQNNAANV